MTRFEVYRAVSAQIHKVLRRFTDLIEPLSLDEAYLDVTEACGSGLTATEIAQDIPKGIKAETGLTASASLSYYKFLAKLASDQDKPDGLTVITPRKGPDFVASLPVGRFNGVGPVTAAKMKTLGILSGAYLRDKSLAFLAEHFRSSAEHYHEISRGVDPRPVRPNRIRKSVGAENTFVEDLTDLDDAITHLKPIIAKVVTRCGEKQVTGRTVTLKVKYADFEQITGRMTLNTAIRDAEIIMSAARKLLGGEYPFWKGIRLLGVSMSGFESKESADEAQLDLFG